MYQTFNGASASVFSDRPEDVLKAEFLAACPSDYIISVYDSFVVDVSLDDMAGQIEGLLDDPRTVGFYNMAVAITESHHDLMVMVERRNGDGRATEASKQVVSVTVLGNRARVRALLDKLDALYDRHSQNTITLWTMRSGHVQSSTLPISSVGQLIPACYPWLPERFLDGYFGSDANILFLIGPPGTGKTSLLRQTICERALSAMVAYDEELFTRDDMFISFVNGRDNLLVIEDADNMLTARESAGNKLITRFLNFSDGLAKFSMKKIIFTTNLGDFDNVDDALIRPGRCYGALNARPLTFEESIAAAQAIGRPEPTERRAYTLAELYNPEQVNLQLRKRAVGFR